MHGPRIRSQAVATDQRRRPSDQHPAANTRPATPACRHPAFVRSCATPTKPGAMACMALRRIDPPTGASRATPARPAGHAGRIRSRRSAVRLRNPVRCRRRHDRDHRRVQRSAGPNPIWASIASKFGLPACTTANGCFRKVNQNGQSSPLPKPSSGWSGEISLDLDMVSAICPKCHILLVEASSDERRRPVRGDQPGDRRWARNTSPTAGAITSPPADRDGLAAQSSGRGDHVQYRRRRVRHRSTRPRRGT